MKKIEIYHRYFRSKGIYSFAWKGLVQLIIFVGITILLVYIAQLYINDFTGQVREYLQRLNTFVVLIIFLTTETILGIIPPDFFIVWASYFPHPWIWLSLLALISYFGGILSYKLGRFLHNIPQIRYYLDKKFLNHINKIHTFGGFIIAFAALLALPFASISMAAGMVRYPFKRFLLFALARFAKFVIHAIILFKIF